MMASTSGSTVSSPSGPYQPSATEMASPPSASSATCTKTIGKPSDKNSDNGSGSDDAPRPMKNVSRERMKAESTFLRTRVQELERELSQTLAQKALERCATPSPVYRDLAKRQAARREKSERDRNRLRARLLHQLQVAKSLEAIFRNRSGAFIDDLCTNDQGSHRYPVDNLAMLHDKFMEEIDEMYPLVDTIFADAVGPYESMEMPFRRSTVRCQEGHGAEKLYVELRNTVYVPFPYERVCNAMWRAITTEYSRQQRLVEQYRCTDDEYSCTFYSQNNAPGFAHRFMASNVMRRFNEENRMALVWRSLNWDQVPVAKREYGDEQGWITVTPVVDAVTGEVNREGVMVRICTRYVPIWEAQVKLIEAGALRIEQAHDEAVENAYKIGVGEVTNRILNGTEEDIAAITESIENILLDEAIGAVDGDLESMISDLDELPDPEQPHHSLPTNNHNDVVLDFQL